MKNNLLNSYLPRRKNLSSASKSYRNNHEISSQTGELVFYSRICRRHGSRNQNRNKIFLRWLIETFPEEFFYCQTKKYKCENIKKPNILDVAGGKGELSVRICICHNARVIMIDPRTADICDCFLKNVYKSLPKKWQQNIFDIKSIRSDFILKLIRSKFRQLSIEFPVIDHFGDNYKLHDVIENSTLIIGLHADNATESIVDIAQRYRIPFVVVPCCVYPNFFPDRILFENKTGLRVPVRTCEQFCRYLQKKNSHFVQESLPFEGRNVGIWWDGIHLDDG